jgi:AP-1 complex subunit gamma-1
MKRDQAD